MSDRWSVVLGVATFVGALAVADGHVGGAPLVVAVAVSAGGLVMRRPAVLCLGAALLAAALGQRSLDGLRAPLDTGPVTEEVTLVADPVPDGRGGVSVDVRLDGRRLRAHARLAPAAALDDRLAGERVLVIGDVRPPGPVESGLRDRHLAGRLDVDAVVGWRPGDPVSRAANGFRRTLSRGADVLSERHASLLAGLTLGDDRDQPADMTDAFRAAGLTHILAVSGQNVAFVMMLAAPALSRLRFGPRLVATLAVLGAFALVTRFEPSVLRATAMAAVAATGAALGRPASTVRILALGVTGIVLVDPLLATSLGFRLSVAGTVGIVVGAARLEPVLPGPQWLAGPLAVTLAAQLAVAPLLVASFGAVPVASLPANLLAVPAAGPVMVWGLTGGLVAGLAGDTVATVVHVPTRALLAWIDGVATAAARWPLGELGAHHVVWLAVAAVASVAAVLGRRRGWRTAALVHGTAGILAVAVLLHAAGGVPGPAVADGVPVGQGARLWQAGGAAVLEVNGRADDETVLAGLRDHRVARLDVIVLASAAEHAADVAATSRRRWPDAMVIGPASAPEAGTVVDVGGLRLSVIDRSPERLDVRVEVREPTAGSARAPPRGPIGSPAVIASALPPVPRVELRLPLGGTTHDLRWRALVAALVPAPRFGREGEVVATVRAAGQAGADIVMAALPPRLVGAAAHAGGPPVAVLASSLEAAEEAQAAGVALVVAPADLAPEVLRRAMTVSVLAGDLGDLARSRAVARDLAVPLAIDTSRLAPVDALAVESVAIPCGCRLVCTTDIRRTRRVVETTAALLAARREQAGARDGS